MQGMGKRAGTYVCSVCHMPHMCDSMLLAHNAMLTEEVDGYLELRWV